MLTIGMARPAVVAGEYVGIGSSFGRIFMFTQLMNQTRRTPLRAAPVRPCSE
jgi:hypothetical protein